MKPLGTSTILITSLIAFNAHAQLSLFDKIKESIPEISDGPSTLQKLLGGGGGCAVGGAAGYFGGKEFADALGKEQELTEEEQEQFALGAAMAGCAVGAATGLAIVNNLSESAKRAQLEAWEEAQKGSGAVTWVDPNDSTTTGTTELAEVETLPSGETCGFRRDVISTSEGSVSPEQRVCQSEGGSWEPVFS